MHLEEFPTTWHEGILTRIIVHVVGGLVSGNDVFTRSSVAQLTVFTATKGKYWNGCQLGKWCIIPTHVSLVPSKRY